MCSYLVLARECTYPTAVTLGWKSEHHHHSVLISDSLSGLGGIMLTPCALIFLPLK